MHKLILRVKLLFLTTILVFFQHASVANESMLVIGNSITMTGPSPDINWFGNWGMAASAVDKDYIHLLTKKLESDHRTKINVKIASSALVDGIFKNPNVKYKENLNHKYDYILIQIGEGVDFTSSSKEDFEARYNDIVTSLKVKLEPKGKLVCLGKWWPNDTVEEVMRNICVNNGGKYASLKLIASNKESLASSERKFANAGVGAHPGDWGMKQIAETVYCAIKNNKCM